MTIAAQDLDSLVSFYTELLGQSPNIYTPDRYAEFSLPQLCLGIFKPKEDQAEQFRPHDQAPAQPSSPLSLCLAVPNLEEALIKSQRAGAIVAPETLHASHGREHYIYDPLGNRIILYEPKPEVSVHSRQSKAVECEAPEHRF